MRFNYDFGDNRKAVTRKNINNENSEIVLGH